MSEKFDKFRSKADLDKALEVVKELAEIFSTVTIKKRNDNCGWDFEVETKDEKLSELEPILIKYGFWYATQPIIQNVEGKYVVDYFIIDISKNYQSPWGTKTIHPIPRQW